ncbi:MAG: aminotransferase, partial [Pseudomonadota bacterium]
MTLQSFLPSTIAKSLESAEEKIRHLTPQEAARDEDFWHQVRQAYTVSANFINMNNGGLSPQPRVVQEAQQKYNDWANEAPSLYMWRTMKLGKEPL